MKRFITKKLINWKNSRNRKPLLLRGARQVGKTWVVKNFGENHFEGKVHIIDFEKLTNLCNVFEKNLDVQRILSEIELLTSKDIVPGVDLLFFDEIQSCPRALMSLRYFYEDMPELHIIAAGSLLEFTLNDISFPVGRIQHLDMFPMNFAEFLLAQKKEKSVEQIISEPQKLSPIIHQMLLDELRKYFFIGGMPESVFQYIETNKVRSSLEIQKELVTIFKADFSKYGKHSNKLCIDTVLSSVAKNVGNQIKYTKLAEGYSGHTIKKSFELLANAKLLKEVPSTSPEGIPLGANASAKKMKSIFLDVGLMQNICGIPVDIEYNNPNLMAIYNGALAEQFVGQELLSSGNTELFYWSRDAKSSNAEVDYLITKNGEIFPIEVKSGPAGKLKSLHLLLQKHKNISNSYVLSTGEYAYLPEHKITFLPLYYAYWLAKLQ